MFGTVVTREELQGHDRPVLTATLVSGGGKRRPCHESRVFIICVCESLKNEQDGQPLLPRLGGREQYRRQVKGQRATGLSIRVH